ncbi:MAG: Fe-S protein assembly co-chaperone HscB [Saprospiraceae bacterium]|nr:Fe-S protein assembly co-chaperone HscB [Saprospiraceae bacterium]
MNYFEFYNIPVSFQVDEAALRRIFYQNSKKFHPDFHTLSDAGQQAEMLEMATLNNEAYQTLLDPDKRMRYILKINGLLEDEGKLPIPQDFLMEMMEINEGLMELELDFDDARYKTTLEAVDTLENTLYQDIQPTLEAYTPESGTRAGLEAVQEYFLKKRYLLRIRENLSKFAAH